MTVIMEGGLFRYPSNPYALPSFFVTVISFFPPAFVFEMLRIDSSDENVVLSTICMIVGHLQFSITGMYIVAMYLVCSPAVL